MTNPDQNNAPPLPWYRRISAGGAAFFLSAVLASINAIYALRGSVLVVQPPEQVILYRDGTGDGAVLTMAVRMAMINAAGPQQGDVLMKASITPVQGGPKFKFSSTVKPVFTDDPKAASNCVVGARCITLPGLLAIEQSDDIVDIPGGTVRAPYLAYPITDWNCEGNAKACGAFVNFSQATAAIAQGDGEFRIAVKFFGDGSRGIMCKGRRVDLNYLRKTGWMTIACKQTDVWDASGW